VVQPLTGGSAAAPGTPSVDADAFNRFEVEGWEGVLDSAVRIPPTITRQPPEVRARIRAAFDELATVHRRPDGSYAIPVSVQVVQGRRP